ncbi:MAG: hypothetical protein ACREU9_00035 [Gammaproteobacteria bacterium]
MAHEHPPCERNLFQASTTLFPATNRHRAVALIQAVAPLAENVIEENVNGVGFFWMVMGLTS